MTDPALDQEMPWDEVRYEKALYDLAELQERLNNARFDLPTMLRTLATQYETPEDFYNSFEASAHETVDSLAQLQKQISSEDVRSALTQAKSSWTQQREGGWEVLKNYQQKRREQMTQEDPVMSDSIFLDFDRLKSVKDDLAQLNIQSETSADDQEVKDVSMRDTEAHETSLNEETTIIGNFKEVHDDLEISRPDETGTIKVTLPLKSTKHFSIERRTRADEDWQYEVKFEDDTKLKEAINASLSSRPFPRDLKYALEMIAAYKIVKGGKCVTCNRLLDNEALTPAARRQVKSGQTESEELHWQAIHLNCLK